MLGLSIGVGFTTIPSSPATSYSDEFFMSSDSAPTVTLSTEASVTDSQSVTKTNVLKFQANKDFSISYDPKLNLRDGASSVADSSSATVAVSMLLDSGNTGNIPSTFTSIQVKAKGGSFVSQGLTISDITLGEWTDFSVVVTTGSANDDIQFDLDSAGSGSIDNGDVIYFHGVSIS